MATRNQKQAQPINILQEADAITGGDRNHDYGHPREDFTAVAEAFNAYLRKKYKENAPCIEAADVPMFQICVKMMREAERPKRDNLVDIAGYARTLEMVNYDPS